MVLGTSNVSWSIHDLYTEMCCAGLCIGPQCVCCSVCSLVVKLDSDLAACFLFEVICLQHSFYLDSKVSHFLLLFLNLCVVTLRIWIILGAPLVSRRWDSLGISLLYWWSAALLTHSFTSLRSGPCWRAGCRGSNTCFHLHFPSLPRIWAMAFFLAQLFHPLLWSLAAVIGSK